jgi:hypothetical protein
MVKEARFDVEGILWVRGNLAAPTQQEAVNKLADLIHLADEPKLASECRRDYDLAIIVGSTVGASDLEDLRRSSRNKPSANAIRADLDRTTLANLVRRERAAVHRAAIQDVLNAAQIYLDETHRADGAHKPRLARRWMDLERAIAWTYNTSANAPVADDELEMVSRRYGLEEIAEERHRVAQARAEIANHERD